MATLMDDSMTRLDSTPPSLNGDMADLNLNKNLNIASKCPSNNRENASSLSSDVDSSTMSVECADDYRHVHDDRPEVDAFAIQLVADVIDSVTGRQRYGVCSDGGADYGGYRETMLRIVSELSSRHGAAFGEMTSKLLSDADQEWVDRSKSSSEAIQVAFDSVVKELLADGRCNWGRVATVYSLASWLARACLENFTADRRDHVINDLKIFAGEVVVNRLTRWIGANGGWVEFERFFRQRPSTPSSTELLSWRGVLVAFAGVGAAALITGLTR